MAVFGSHGALGSCGMMWRNCLRCIIGSIHSDRNVARSSESPLLSMIQCLFNMVLKENLEY